MRVELVRSSKTPKNMSLGIRLIIQFIICECNYLVTATVWSTLGMDSNMFSTKLYPRMLLVYFDNVFMPERRSINALKFKDII